MIDPRVIALGALVVLAGCSGGLSDTTTETPEGYHPETINYVGDEGGVAVYIDDAGGVVCYDTGDALDCLPIEETGYA